MNNKKVNSGRPKTVRLQQTIQQIKNEIDIEPYKSVRRLEFENQTYFKLS